jgi:hypothetical protein
MRKYVILAREAFTDLLRSVGSKEIKSSSRLADYRANRAKIAEGYRKATGKDIPDGKVVIPQRLHNELKAMRQRRKDVTGNQEYETLAARRRYPNAEPRDAGYTREQPKRDQRKGGPLFPMGIGKRTYEEGQRMLTLKAEREAARSGRKINRTKYVTRRDLEEDTF